MMDSIYFVKPAMSPVKNASCLIKYNNVKVVTKQFSLEFWIKIILNVSVRIAIMMFIKIHKTRFAYLAITVVLTAWVN